MPTTVESLKFPNLVWPEVKRKVADGSMHKTVTGLWGPNEEDWEEIEKIWANDLGDAPEHADESKMKEHEEDSDYSYVWEPVIPFPVVTDPTTPGSPVYSYAWSPQRENWGGTTS